MTEPTRDPVDVKPHRKAFRDLTREHDRLLMLLVDPRPTNAEIEEQLEHVTRAANEYLYVAHSEIQLYCPGPTIGRARVWALPR